jgi:hypothetical protein
MDRGDNKLLCNVAGSSKDVEQKRVTISYHRHSNRVSAGSCVLVAGIAIAINSLRSSAITKVEAYANKLVAIADKVAANLVAIAPGRIYNRKIRAGTSVRHYFFGIEKDEHC